MVRLPASSMYVSVHQCLNLVSDPKRLSLSLDLGESGKVGLVSGLEVKRIGLKI